MDRYTADPLGSRLQDLHQGTAFISKLTLVMDWFIIIMCGGPVFHT
jgi:hypothetical protein